MRLFLICECCCEPQTDGTDEEDKRFTIEGDEGSEWAMKARSYAYTASIPL